MSLSNFYGPFSVLFLPRSVSIFKVFFWGFALFFCLEHIHLSPHFAHLSVCLYVSGKMAASLSLVRQPPTWKSHSSASSVSWGPDIFIDKLKFKKRDYKKTKVNQKKSNFSSWLFNTVFLFFKCQVLNT